MFDEVEKIAVENATNEQKLWIVREIGNFKMLFTKYSKCDKILNSTAVNENDIDLLRKLQTFVVILTEQLFTVFSGYS